MSDQIEVAELPSERAQRHAIALGFFDKPPPRDIKVDRGLPPKRTELAKFLAWEQRTRDEIVDLQRRRIELASAIAAPARTHEQIAQLERADLANLRTASGPVSASAELGSKPLSMTPSEFGKFIAVEIEKWAKVIKAAGIKAE